MPIDKPAHLMNRYYKILIDDLITPRYKGSIYLDGNVTVRGKLSDLINPYYDLIVHDHLRTCIYDEAKTYNIYMGEFVKAILKLINTKNQALISKKF